MPTVEAGSFSCDDHVVGGSADIKQISRRGNESRILADFQATKPIRDTGDLGRLDGDGSKGL